MAGEEVLILSTVLLLVLIPVVYARRYVRAPPDKAMVVFGRRRPNHEDGFIVVTPGGAKFVVPIVEQVAFMDVGMHLLEVSVQDTTTKQGVPLTIDLVAYYRVGQSNRMLHDAARSILSRSREDIDEAVQKIVASSVRTIAVDLAVEQVNADRDAFGSRVRDAGRGPLAELGLELGTCIVKDVSDQVGYMEALGKRRTAEVKRDAILAEATARRDAVLHAAVLEKEAQQIRFETDAQIAELQKERDKKIAGYAAEVDDHKRKVSGKNP